MTASNICLQTDNKMYDIQLLMDSFNKRRLNTQILTKTQLALQAIKRYDMDQPHAHFSYSNPVNSNKLLTDLDQEYSRLTAHKHLMLDHKYKISLFSYSEEFYILEMRSYIFPMRVLVKNVKNEGTIFIGYDQPYPGIQMNRKQTVFQKDPHNDKNYDSKTLINRDLIIILKNKANKQVSNVYFTIVAGKSFFMCDLKVEFLGFVRDQRIKSEVQLSSSVHKIQPKSYTENPSQIISKRNKTNPNQRQYSQGKEFRRTKIALDKLERPFKVEEFCLLNQVQMVKHQSKSNVSLEQTNNNKFHTKRVFYPTQTIRNTMMRDFRQNGHKRDRSQLDAKIQEVKRNKQMVEEYRIKDKQLKEIAGKCKRMIESYKKTFNQENVKKRKLNKDLVLILYCSKFIRTTFLITDNRIKRETNKIKVSYLVDKFAKRIKKEYSDTCQLQPFRFKRTINQGVSGISFFSKIINKHCCIKAERTLKQTFDFLHPMFLVKHSISVAHSYRNSVKLIQRSWKVKYHSRLSCLLYFVDNHIQKMLKEFPHFHIFHQPFYQSKSNRLICLEYIKDESQKYRYIYQAYKRKLEQIQQICKMNESIIKDKHKSRSMLQVPRKPTKPMHRFYRNTDILKSMVRTWFEIEYKKYIKKSQKKLKY